MAHRSVLTENQRNQLLNLPSDEPTLLRHYVLSEEDLNHIHKRLNPHNRLGFALQLCAFRYPGRYLQKGELLPDSLLSFVASQLGISQEAIVKYASRPETRYHHTKEIRRIYKYTPYSKVSLLKFQEWLFQTAMETRSNLELATLFVQECRTRKIILPGITVIERTCADARVAAERVIVDKMASRIDDLMKERLRKTLDETIDGRLTIHGWLKRFEAGHNSADVNRLLKKLKYLKNMDIPASLLDDIPPHRIIWLRQQGEAYYADGLRDINESRRLAILATCAIEWKAMLIDTILETHDRIVGKLYNACKRIRDGQLADHKKQANETLAAFVGLSKKLLKAHAGNQAVVDVITDPDALKTLITTASALTKKLDSDPLEFVLSGYGLFRRYTQHMLEEIAFEGNQPAQPLLKAITLLKALNQSDKHIEDDLPIDFANATWRKRLGRYPERKLWETAVLFAIRDGLRSRDIWVVESRRYQDSRQQLLPVKKAEQVLSLPIPL